MNKVRVGILGATGLVGQKFIELLADHPWLEVSALAASDGHVGKLYRELVDWRMETSIPPHLAEMPLLSCAPDLPCEMVFSSLPGSVAGEIESQFAEAGYTVISNSRNHRMDPKVPLIVPEVNSDHMLLVEQQTTPGKIITNPNCSVTGIVMAFKPLVDQWGIQSAHLVTLQALSGAGKNHPQMVDNVIPFISGEEEKIETEPLKIFGHLTAGAIIPSTTHISAQCTRVPVVHGHMACISVKTQRSATKEEMINAWSSFNPKLGLPSAPERPLVYFSETDFPQPHRHRDLGQGMTVSIGRLQRCSVFDWKFVVLSHNLIRGAAGCAILNAELFLQKRSKMPQGLCLESVAPTTAHAISC